MIGSSARVDHTDTLTKQYLVKTVLCYGDSNTWGYEPGTARRFPKALRWPGVLQYELGHAVHVIEEGLNGRTTVLDDPTRVAKNGMTYLRPCLDSHAPLDLIILMLGTNDLKHRFGLSAFDIAAGVSMLVSLIQQTPCGPEGTVPPLLLISPPLVGPLSMLAGLFEGAEPKSRELADHYQMVARQVRCSFLDAAKVVGTSPIDGVHLDVDAHKQLGLAVAAKLKEMLVL